MPKDESLFVAIENGAGQHFFYQAGVFGNRFECSGHHLGEEHETPGNYYMVRMFIPAQGSKLYGGPYRIMPPGKYASDPVTYKRL
jgi:hypothetical protein